MSNFKEKYLANDVTIEKIDDFVDMWHEKKSNVTLQKYLGLTDSEYQAHIKGTKYLKQKLDTLKYQSTGSFSQKINQMTKS